MLKLNSLNKSANRFITNHEIKIQSTKVSELILHILLAYPLRVTMLFRNKLLNHLQELNQR